MATKFDITGFRGSNLFVELTGLNETGTPMDLSGFSVSGHARFQPSYTGKLLDLEPSIFSGISGVAFSSGLIQISVGASSMAAVPVTEGKYDIEIWNASGTSATGLFAGKFAVFSEYTF
jgi:hypothetical protein